MYKIKEDGTNGTVEIEGQRVIRTFKKKLGRNDVQTIPASSISHVDVDRRALGSDKVTVHVGTQSYTWKTEQAEELADRILALKEA